MFSVNLHCMEYRFDECVLDDAQRTLTRAGDPVSLEPQVFDLLLLLVQNSERVITKDELIDVIWGGRIVSESAISARIAAARKAVGDDGKRQAVIRTRARRGLQMAAEVVPQVDDESFEGIVSVKSEMPMPRIRYTTNASGKAIAYALSGKGSPVVRCNNGSHLEMEWNSARDKAMFSLVHERNSLLRIDFAGVGMSERSIDQISFDDQAEDIRSAVDAAGLTSFALFSETGGVHAALRFAARYPERVTKLAIIGGYVDGRDRRNSHTGPDFLRSMLEEGWDGPHSSLTRAFCLAYCPDGPIDEVDEYAAVLFSSIKQVYAQLHRDAINGVENAYLLDQIRCPTLVVHARRDAVHPLSEARKLATGIAEAELVVLDSANHLPFPGHPSWETFAQAFREFLAD